MKLFIGDEIQAYSSDKRKFIDIFIKDLTSNISCILWVMDRVSLNKILSRELKKWMV